MKYSLKFKKKCLFSSGWIEIHARRINTQSNGLVRCSLTAGKTNSYVDSKQTRMKFLFENHAKREYFVFCGLSNYLTLEGYELLISDALHLSLDKARVLFPRCH